MNPEMVTDVAVRLLPGLVMAVEVVATGHIHDTFVVTTSAGPARYTVQRLNDRVFPDPAAMSAAVARVAAFQQRRLAAAGCPDAHRRALTPIGPPSVTDAEGRCWRAFLHIEGGRSHARPASAAMAGQMAAVAGRFLVEVADLEGPALTEAIPGFRDFRSRLAALEAAIEADRAGRAAACAPEVEAVGAAAVLVDELESARTAGDLPLRTVHNDAKADNVLVDDATGEGLCMIDLDTTGPGSVLFDVGDLVRSAANVAGEDDPWAPAAVRPDLLEAVVTGYLGAAGHLLTPAEVGLLPLAGPLMAFEAAVRFLTDHLAGDVYFRTARPGHNLDRARAQLRLLAALAGARSLTADLVARYR